MPSRWVAGVVLGLGILSCAHLAQSASRQTAQPQQPGAGAEAAPDKPEMRIAAVVNDEVISMFDLVSRMRMVLGTSNIQDSPETRQKLASQVLRSLIDEKLELQEVKKQNVTASDTELKSSLDQIEKQNN